MARTRKTTAASRAAVSIDPTANRNPQTNLRRAQLWSRFCRWSSAELQIDFEAVSNSPHLAGSLLIAYGKHLFYTGEPKYAFIETVNACVDNFPFLKGQLSAVWLLVTKWEEAEPVERAMVMPPAVFSVAVAVALLWNWPRFAAALLIGFHGLLRPAEFIELHREHLVLPRDVLSQDQICYVAILHAKTKRYMLRQHARISDATSVMFLDALFGCTPGKTPLFGCTLGVFRNRWNKVFKFLGVGTCEAERGVTPKSLRGSGASWLYHCTEDVDRILWRGRWQNRKTLEHYLQDVMGQILLSDLVQERQDAIKQFAAAAPSLLVSASRSFGSTAR